jgi:hypothetical protein
LEWLTESQFGNAGSNEEVMGKKFFFFAVLLNLAFAGYAQVAGARDEIGLKYGSFVCPRVSFP